MPINESKTILLMITGGIACYKSLDLLRRLKEQGYEVDVILTRSAQQFITPLLVESLSGRPVYTDLFALGQEASIGHIALARKPECIVVAPATADFMARMVQGRADDLATTVLLATRAKVVVVPAMNPVMWSHIATQTNVQILKDRGVNVMTPDAGVMACGETGIGRFPDIDKITDHIVWVMSKPILKGRRILITAGGTKEPLDPVRFLTNASSGKQGYAIAKACIQAGATVTLVTASPELPLPYGLYQAVNVQTAKQMFEAVMTSIKEKSQPYDAFISTAAVADWGIVPSNQKLKKTETGVPPALIFHENPDILKTVSCLNSTEKRPSLVIGFAAETENVLPNAVKKRERKRCDWMLANDVSPSNNVFGGDHNHITFLNHQTNFEDWGKLIKTEVACKLVKEIATYFET